MPVPEILQYIGPAHLYLYADVPTGAPPLLTLDSQGQPQGVQRRYLGATQGPVQVQLRATIEGVDVEQVFGQVAHHVREEVAQLQATLLEQDPAHLALAAGAVTQINLQPNPSFERATPGDATLAAGYARVGNPTTALVADAHPADGTRAQEVAATAGGQGLESAPLYDPVCAPGAVLGASVFVKGPTAGPTVQLTLEALDATGTAVGSAQATVALTTSYQRLAAALALPAGSRGVRWRLVVTTTDGGTVRLDNAQVEVLPAASAAPQPYVPAGTLFFGGKLDCPTFSVTMVAQKRGVQPPRFHGAMLYRAYASGGLTLSIAKASPRPVAVTFLGLPVPDRAPGDQYGQLFEQQ